jgi:hypothetical protein
MLQKKHLRNLQRAPHPMPRVTKRKKRPRSRLQNLNHRKNPSLMLRKKRNNRRLLKRKNLLLKNNLQSKKTMRSPSQQTHLQILRKPCSMHWLKKKLNLNAFTWKMPVYVSPLSEQLK